MTKNGILSLIITVVTLYKIGYIFSLPALNTIIQLDMAVAAKGSPLRGTKSMRCLCGCQYLRIRMLFNEQRQGWTDAVEETANVIRPNGHDWKVDTMYEMTYKTEVKVYVGKKHVGTIVENGDGYSYKPKGSKTMGGIYATIQAVKNTL